MTLIISEEYLKNILGKVAETCELTQWKYTKTYLSEMGQNYFGDILPVTVTGRIGQQDINLQLIMKLAPTDEKFRVSGAMGLMFIREVYVYTVILKKFSEIIQQYFPSNCQLTIPRCYYACNEYSKEVLVLQNMCSDGYKPYVSEMFLDKDHVIVSLHSIATLHALSLILKNSDKIFFDTLAEECKPLSEETNSRFMEILRDRLSRVTLLFEGTQYFPILQKIKDNLTTCFEMVAEEGTLRQTVICHADIWKENIMFKYENDQPILSCLLDYQTARVSSPAFDFLYFLIVSCDSATRENMEEFIEIYHSTLSEVLSQANMKVEEIYSLQDFKEDLKSVAPACLAVANTALWLFNGLVTDGHVKSKKPYRNEEEKLKALDKHRNLIRDIIDDYHRYVYCF